MLLQLEAFAGWVYLSLVRLRELALDAEDAETDQPAHRDLGPIHRILRGSDSSSDDSNRTAPAATVYGLNSTLGLLWDRFLGGGSLGTEVAWIAEQLMDRGTSGGKRTTDCVPDSERRQRSEVCLPSQHRRAIELYRGARRLTRALRLRRQNCA